MKYIKEYSDNKYYTQRIPNSPLPIQDAKPIYINKNDITYIKSRLGIDTQKDILVTLINVSGSFNCYIFFYNAITGEIGNLNTMNNVHKSNVREVIIISYTDEWYKVTIDDRKGVDCSNVYWCDQIEGVVQCVKDSINRDVYNNNINESSVWSNRYNTMSEEDKMNVEDIFVLEFDNIKYRSYLTSNNYVVISVDVIEDKYQDMIEDINQKYIPRLNKFGYQTDIRVDSMYSFRLVTMSRINKRRIIISVFREKNNINESSSLDKYSNVMDKINNVSNSNYYQKLSDEDKKKLSDMLVNMDDKTYSILYDKFDSLGYIDIDKYGDYCIAGFRPRTAKNDWMNIYIYNCSDDWFIVIAGGRMYKCDQLPGVIMLLDDLQECIT